MQESETANRTDPLQKIESSGKPDFSVVYATRIEFLRTTAVDKVEELLNRPKLTQVPENWGKGSSLIQ